MVSGSPMMAPVGLPLGRMEIRCEHAAPPRTQSYDAMALATEFYRENCIGCPHRDSTGIPNLKTEVENQDAAREQRRREQGARLAALAARRAARRRRRRLAVASEGYVVRDLAEVIDHLDVDDHADGSSTVEQAARELVESARRAAGLLTPPLVDSLVELAIDTGEPAALVAITELVRANRCEPRTAVHAALAVLATHPVPEAGELLAAFPTHLYRQDLAPVLDALVRLAAGKHLIVTTVAPAPLGLLAAVSVDLPQVTTRLLDGLKSGDEQLRADTAAACEQLLAEDAARVIALGAALVAACRDDDPVYARRTPSDGVCDSGVGRGLAARTGDHGGHHRVDSG